MRDGSSPVKDLSCIGFLGSLIDYYRIVWAIGNPLSLGLALLNFWWPGISYSSHHHPFFFLFYVLYISPIT